VCLKVTVTVQLVLRVNSERVTIELDRGKLKQCATMFDRKVMCTDKYIVR